MKEIILSIFSNLKELVARGVFKFECQKDLHIYPYVLLQIRLFEDEITCYSVAIWENRNPVFEAIDKRGLEVYNIKQQELLEKYNIEFVFKAIQNNLSLAKNPCCANFNKHFGELPWYVPVPIQNCPWCGATFTYKKDVSSNRFQMITDNYA